jgi:ABC-type sugar transport system substrate-binding protein
MNPRRHRSRRPLVLVCTALALVLTMVLAACGSSDDDKASGGGSGGGKSAKSVKLAIVTATSTQNAMQEMDLGGKSAGSHDGITLQSAAPNGINGPEEVKLFQASVQTSKDGIGVMTTTPDLFLRPFAQAVDRGVPVVAIDAAPPPGSNVDTFVGNSNTDLGRQLGTKMLEKIPEDATGEIVMGNDIPGLPLLEARLNGMKEVISKARPNLKIVGPFNVGAEPTENYNHWNSLVKAHPNAVAYLAPGDQDAVSFNRIAKTTGKKYLVGACDVDPIALEAVKNGNVYALGDPQHWLKGYVAISLLAAHAKDGKDIPKGWWNPGSAVIDSSNVDQIIERQKDNNTRYAYYKKIVDEQLANPTKYVKPLDQAD